MLKHAHFRPKIDRIFTYRVLMRGVAAGWDSVAMALVHLLMHARWWGYLTSLGWAVAKEEGNIFIFSQ